MAPCRRRRGKQVLEFFSAVGEVAALGAVERIAEGGEGGGGALGFTQGTPGNQTCRKGAGEEEEGKSMQ